MANVQAAKKANRQSEARKLVNKTKISRIRTEKKKFLQFLSSNLESAKEQFIKTQSLLAKAAKKKIIHWRKASRLISRMANKLKGH